MFKYFSISLFGLLISQMTLGQIKAIVIDSKTKEKIPYVNIWNENGKWGTSSNDEGVFDLIKFDSSTNFIFSAIGYKTASYKYNSISTFVELIQEPKELKEVVVQSRKNTIEYQFGNFKKSEVKHSWVTGGGPLILANLFPHKEVYNKTPFLKKIGVLTISDVNNAKFNLRLYELTEKGEPGSLIYENNIIGIAKKGKNITEIDISNLNISFPQKGLFIAYEFLIMESNKFEYTYTQKDSREKFKTIDYEPNVGTIPCDFQERMWSYKNGNWVQADFKFLEPKNEIKGKFHQLAIQLTLSN